MQGTKVYYDANHKDDITGGWYEADIRELDKRGIMVGDGKRFLLARAPCDTW